MPGSIELPPPPDISRTLRYFRSRGLFCDVRLRLTPSDGAGESSAVEMLAHRVVLAAASPYFADRIEEDLQMPAELSVDAMRFLLLWMYNDVCKLELSSDQLNMDFLDRLRLGARLLVIPDLERFIGDLIQNLKTGNNTTTTTTTSDGSHELVKREINESDFDDDDDDDDVESFEADDDVDMDGGGASFDFGAFSSFNSAVGDSLLTSMNGDDDASFNNDANDADGARNGSGHLLAVIPFEGDDSLEGKKSKKLPSSTSKAVAIAQTKAEARALDIGGAKSDRKDMMTIPCEKCGRRVRRGDLASHHAFFHSDLAEDIAVDRLLNPPKDDPILLRHLSPDVVNADGVDSVGGSGCLVRFQCSLCEFTMISDSVADKNSASPKDPLAPPPMPPYAFRRNCAKHLFTRHSVVCPTICFPCPKPNCDSVMWSSRTASIHLREQHGPKAKIPKKPCHFCGVLLKESSLKQHIQLVHSESQQLPCPSCKKVFRNALYLKLHMRVHAPAGEKEFTCQDCNGEFQSNDRLQFRHHVWSKHGKNFDEGDMFNCPSCDYKTPIESIMKKHIREDHLTRTPFPCPDPECNKIFRTQRLMQMHNKRVHGEGDGRKCDICGADFRSKSGYDYHLWRVHHQGKNGSVKDDNNFRLERPYKCPYCSHTSGLSGNMRKHVMNVHKGLQVHYIDLRATLSGDNNDPPAEESNAIQDVEANG